MKAGSSSPSARLRRAAEAERRDLGRRRDALLERCRRLRTELEELEGRVADIEERLTLLDRLTGIDTQPPTTPPAPHPAPPDGHCPSPGAQPLRGPAIRAAAVRVALAQPQPAQALHYRQWFALLREAGHTIAGKDPLAVFLTQISRSPLVRHGTQSGVYELDLAAPDRLRADLERLHAELRELTTAGATADLSSIRRHRTALAQAITKTEKALQEATQTLDETRHAA